jgi:8-oxo-dGTP pyrophosphatase MutT (NUDIX family)
MYPNDLEALRAAHEIDADARAFVPPLAARLRAALEPDPRHEPDAGDRLAAVLIPVLEDGTVVFTKRSEELSRHAGEISFPGGLRHDEDAGPADTALRETEEELGVAASDVEVLGALSPVHTHVSAILIVPFVGLLGERPVFRPNPAEIAEVLEYPLGELAGAETEVEWRRDGGVYRGYAYEMADHTIWGATARILHELLEVLRDGATGGKDR